MEKRFVELQNFKAEMEKLHKFLNQVDADLPINIVDPKNKLHWFGCNVEKLLSWIKQEIKTEENNENQKASH